MNRANAIFHARPTPVAPETLWTSARKQRPSFRWSDIWKAPVHDFPIRDEVLYQYLPLSPEMRILEVGPGSGFTAFRLARHVQHLTSVDIAASNIRRLRDILSGVPNLRLACADVCAAGLAEAVGSNFDAVFALEVLEYASDPGGCFKNLAMVLRRGGRLLMQWPNYRPARTGGLSYFRRRQELDRLLDVAGFQVWAVYALKLQTHAGVLFRAFHERPLRLYRRLRHSRGLELPQAFDETWAFRSAGRLERYKSVLHGCWTALFAVMRLGGDCFERSLLGNEIVDRNLLLVARR